MVGSCSKMALDGSFIVEICDETLPKMWRKLVEMLSKCRHRWPKRNMRVCMGNKEFETWTKEKIKNKEKRENQVG